MLKKYFYLLIALQLGCATIMKEEWEDIYIETDPPGAIVNVDNGQKCFTPCHLELARKKNYNLVIRKDGFAEKKYFVSGRSIDGWLWGNLVFLLGLPIAVGVDFYTGNAYDFSPSHIVVQLEAK